MTSGGFAKKENITNMGYTITNNVHELAVS
jgi:hypothetical protein